MFAPALFTGVFLIGFIHAGKLLANHLPKFDVTEIACTR